MNAVDRAIEMVLAGGKIATSARKCGVSYSTLYRNLRLRRKRMSERVWTWNGKQMTEIDVLHAVSATLCNVLQKYGLDEVRNQDGVCGRIVIRVSIDDRSTT